MTQYRNLVEVNHNELMTPLNVNGLFGWLHALPTHSQSDIAVLICPALTLDSFDLHQPLRVLADGLAAAGYPTMRFNYPDIGDSIDIVNSQHWGKEHLEAWQQSIHEAADWLRGSTGARHLVFCGLRIGATLATLAAEQRNDVAGLILLAPVLRGRSYLRQLWIEAGMQNGPVPPLSEGLDFDELHLSAETVRLISQVDLRHANLPSGQPIAIFAKPDSKLLIECVEAWTNKGAEVTRIGFEGLEPIIRDYVESEHPSADTSGIIDWLRQAVPAGPSRIPRTSIPACAPLRSPGCIETPLRFGPNSRLFGILCRPDQNPREMAVIITNSGRVPHYGFGRFGVEFARRLAAEGVTSLRMDFAGLGDSLGPVGKENLVSALFETDRTPDISAAIDALERLGHRRIAIYGSCAGAYHAFHAALADQRVGTLLLVNLPLFIWREGETVTFARQRTFPFSHYLRMLTNQRGWSRLLRGEFNSIGLLRGQLDQLCRRVLATPLQLLGLQLGRSSSESFASNAMATLSRRRTKTLFLFAPDEVGIHAFEQSFGPRGIWQRHFADVSMQIVPEFDHNLGRRSARRIAAALMVEFLSSAYNLTKS